MKGTYVKWLVTGGAGYIGSHLVQARREFSRDVVAGPA
jgi:nucleoside-diphosphate-sugar epimerase